MRTTLEELYAQAAQARARLAEIHAAQAARKQELLAEREGIAEEKTRKRLEREAAKQARTQQDQNRSNKRVRAPGSRPPHGTRCAVTGMDIGELIRAWAPI